MADDLEELLDRIDDTVQNGQCGSFTWLGLVGDAASCAATRDPLSAELLASKFDSVRTELDGDAATVCAAASVMLRCGARSVELAQQQPAPKPAARDKMSEKILAALGDGPATAAQLCITAGADRFQVAWALRYLVADGTVERRVGADVEATYHLVSTGS